MIQPGLQNGALRARSAATIHRRDDKTGTDPLVARASEEQDEREVLKVQPERGQAQQPYLASWAECERSREREMVGSPATRMLHPIPRVPRRTRRPGCS